MNSEINDKLRLLPSIDALLIAAFSCGELSKYSAKLLTAVLREVVAKARQDIQNGENISISKEDFLNKARCRLDKIINLNLHRVINATGVVLHTNLGRAPLSKRARQAVRGIISNYSSLEYNIADGQRGSRHAHVADAFRQLTGAEDALVVNNNAAAILLIMSSLAKEKEVIVSRGELVEIGGSFRIPDVLKESGAHLVEVGTTNRTHLSDYEKAITPRTAAILKVHTSNYRIIGFTNCPPIDQLAKLAREHNLPLVEDLGSGTLIPLEFGDEPTVKGRLESGVDVVAFSGDKLLGSAQAGIILGLAKYIAPLKTHPLARAVRIDKLSLAALEGTLKDYQLGYPLLDVPVLHMLHQSKDELHDKARGLTAALMPLEKEGWGIEIIPVHSMPGGGSFPAVALESFGVAVISPLESAASLEKKLRNRCLPIITRIEDNKIVIDVRCLFNSDIEEIAKAFFELAHH